MAMRNGQTICRLILVADVADWFHRVRAGDDGIMDVGGVAVTKDRLDPC